MSARVLQRVALTVLLVLAGPLTRVRGQDVLPSISQLQKDHDAAYDAYEAAVSAQTAQVERFQTAHAQVEEAKRLGDEDALAAAVARSYTVSQDLSLARRRVEERREALEEARGALLQGLDRERERLEDELVAAATPARAEAARSILEDLENRYRELERQPQELPDDGVVFYASLRMDPREGRTEWQQKADLLELRVTGAEERIQDVDEEIDRLEARLRLRRSGERQLSGLNRFDNTTLPTGVSRAGPPEAGEVAADSVTALERLPLDEQIAWLQTYRGQLEEFLEQLRNQVRIYQDLLGGAG